MSKRSKSYENKGRKRPKSYENGAKEIELVSKRGGGGQNDLANLEKDAKRAEHAYTDSYIGNTPWPG